MNDTDTAANKALVEEFFRAFSAGDPGPIMDMIHDDGSWWVSGSIPGMSGTHAKVPFGQLLAGASSVYEAPMTLTPGMMTAEGNRIAAEAKSYAKLKDGRVYANSYHFLIEVRDGKIFSVREYMDTAHATETFIG